MIEVDVVTAEDDKGNVDVVSMDALADAGPESDQEEAQELTKEQQLYMDLNNMSVVCSCMMNTEVMLSNEKYPPFFRTTKEALGVIYEEFLEVRECLRKIKHPGAAEKGDLEHLKAELVQLGAMSIKAIYSLCDINAETDAMMKQYQMATTGVQTQATDSAENTEA